jgi:tryptophan synthase alpha chain
MRARLGRAFQRIRDSRAPALVAYVTAGDPDPVRSAGVLRAISSAGADVIEVGVPFSDPLADGPVIQRASERALASGMTLRRTLDLVAEVRRTMETPIVLFTYANPVVRMDARTFASRAADAGVDGVLILDFPIEEAAPLRGPIVDAGLDPIFLVSPTTSDERIRQSGELGAGFLYVISRLGVTGPRDSLASDVQPLLERVRAHSSLPIALGFGISTPQQVAQACTWADAAVVGSALVNVVAEHAAADDLYDRVSGYVKWLKGTP